VGERDRGDPPPDPESGPSPFDQLDEKEITNTALKRIPLTSTVAKQYEYFADWLQEFGDQLYPQGIFVPTSYPKPKGSLVKLDFRTNAGAVIFAAIGLVVRSDEAVPGTRSGMWIGFKVIEEPYRQMVDRICAERALSTGKAPGAPRAGE